ncbi:MAG: peptide ABC transporter permease, partial [Pseudomonadota bacterium]|nr:peptide ABC transporter permease [Pseudomonadota bacterium]
MPQFSLYDEEFHPSPWQRTWASFKASHIAMLGLIMLALFVVCALFAPI